MPRKGVPVNYFEVRRYRGMTPPMPWKEIAAIYGMKDATLRGHYYRWENTDEAQQDQDFDLPEPAYRGNNRLIVTSRPDNTYLFGVAGDRHHASKYHRDDVLEDLYKEFELEGVDAIFDTGNWIDGESRFNKFDVTRIGFEQQILCMAEGTPRTKIPQFAVWGDDHEGWYAKREGIDVGKRAEDTMREHGHDWTDLGFMEAYVELRNAHSGKSSILSVQHPGGGSAYALSYKPQKIVEALEGGEKPAVAFMGHYHKLECLNVRNVWALQTGCVCDQTTFMRKKSIEAHVGGTIILLRQDPESGAITRCRADMLRYFNKGFYNRRWSYTGGVVKPLRTLVPQGGHS